MGAPLIKKCSANFEAKLVDTSRYQPSSFSSSRSSRPTARRPKYPQMVHYRGDGVFMLSGRNVSYRSSSRRTLVETTPNPPPNTHPPPPHPITQIIKPKKTQTTKQKQPPPQPIMRLARSFSAAKSTNDRTFADARRPSGCTMWIGSGSSSNSPRSVAIARPLSAGPTRYESTRSNPTRRWQQKLPLRWYCRTGAGAR